jgi:hypothetical protein
MHLKLPLKHFTRENMSRGDGAGFDASIKHPTADRTTVMDKGKGKGNRDYEIDTRAKTMDEKPNDDGTRSGKVSMGVRVWPNDQWYD